MESFKRPLNVFQFFSMLSSTMSFTTPMKRIHVKWPSLKICKTSQVINKSLVRVGEISGRMLRSFQTLIAQRCHQTLASVVPVANVRLEAVALWAWRVSVRPGVGLCSSSANRAVRPVNDPSLLSIWRTPAELNSFWPTFTRYRIQHLFLV